MDKRSGFNLLQAAVFEGDYSTVFKAHGLLNNFVKEMNFETTGNDARNFPGKTAVDILSSLDVRGRGHADIDEFYYEMVGKVNTLTELHLCAKYDDAEKAVELVLNDGVDINIPAKSNRTPLLWVNMSSSGMLIKALIDLGADVNAQRTDNKGTPLMLASCWNNYMATHLLLEHGADANIQASNGYAPLHESVRRGLFEVSQLLIGSGCNINLQNEIGRTPLHTAAWNNQVKLVTLLLENNADANIQNSAGDTPLNGSVSRGLFEVSQLLIKSGCNINLQNNESETPLYVAFRNKHEHLWKLLLECNADVSMRCKQNPRDRLYLVCGIVKGKPAWHYVMVEKQLLGLFLKRTKGGSLDVADFGKVIESGWGKDPPENTEEKIVKREAAMFKEVLSSTLLHVASRKNNTEVTDLLVNYGADINARDTDGFTPLHVAAILGNLEVVKKLVDLKADVNLATVDGKDAADLAHLNEELEIEEYIKSKIASSQRPKGKEVERYITYLNILSEAYSYSFGSLQYRYGLTEDLKSLSL